MAMTSYARAALCERARGWASLAPDDELSELERKLLDSHLDRCPACASFALEVAAVAKALRTARPEPLPQPVAVTVWRRRPAYASIRSVGAAAAVALMAVGIAARAPLSPIEQDRVDLPRVTNFSNTAPQREVELINRRTQNEVARHSRFRPDREGLATRPI